MNASFRTAAFVLACLAGGRASAQSVPKLAGTWKVPPATPTATKRGTGSSTLGNDPGTTGKAAPTLYITQDGKYVTVSKATEAGALKGRYPLDGSSFANTILVKGRSIPNPTTAKWVGDTLVVSSDAKTEDNFFRTTSRIYKNAAGLLVLESEFTTKAGTSRDRTVYALSSPIVP